MTPRAGYTAAQVRAAERPLLAAGIPLMRHAAAALAAELRGFAPRRVLVLVGAGDNGGDALFAVAEVAADGVTVDLVPTASRHHAEGAAAAISAGAQWVDAADAARLAAAADVVLDGILGTGTSGSPGLRGAARDVVAAILPVLDAPERPRVVAVDIPSGIGPDDGAVPDPTVLPADLTVTFGATKAGLLIDPGSRYAGRVVLVDLGLGPYLGEPVVIAE
ncbi:NAD(P)H-hydrate epimerase [Pseudolysinimonas sp.]|uniref:NAD(P)H-hydrate epimerase n=1 Tax=Pseudolysinimonas sp. TaxID=2680009 RepID=UPI00286A7066|nr:NAD(P)H-hydrate epimerase [Pseudolysinimonas sp.]